MKLIHSITKSTNSEYLTLVKPEIVVKNIVIAGAVAMMIVLSKPILEAKIVWSIVVINHYCILSEAVLAIAANNK